MVIYASHQADDRSHGATMTREDLLRHLDELASPTTPACFVALWTYLTGARLSKAEESLDYFGILPSRLRSRISKDSPANLPPDGAIGGLRERLQRPRYFSWSGSFGSTRRSEMARRSISRAPNTGALTASSTAFGAATT